MGDVQTLWTSASVAVTAKFLKSSRHSQRRISAMLPRIKRVFPMTTTQYYVRQRPHQTLEALAAYHLGVLSEKLAAGTSNGIAHDCTSLLIALAFYVEALVNLVGLSVFKADWRERDAYQVKLSKIAKRLGFTVDVAVEPYATFALLKQIRDQLAHPKPANSLLLTGSDAEAFSAISPSWYRHCEPQFASESYRHACEFKTMLVERARLKRGALLSSVSNVD
jgi:hypothetical protein